MQVLALGYTLSRQRSPLLTQHCLTATPSEKLEKTPTQGPALGFPELSEMPIGYQRDTTAAPSRMMPRLPKCTWAGASLQRWVKVSALCPAERLSSPHRPSGRGLTGGGHTEPGPRRAAAGGVGRHLRAGPATAAPGAGDGERGWKTAGEGKGREGFGWEREPGDAVTAWGADGEVGAGLCHRFVVEERLPCPFSVPPSAGRILPVLPRSSCSHPCFTAQAGAGGKQLSKLQAELEQCPRLFIGAFVIARKDAFPSPLRVFKEEVARPGCGTVSANCAEFGYSLNSTTLQVIWELRPNVSSQSTLCF